MGKPTYAELEKRLKDLESAFNASTRTEMDTLNAELLSKALFDHSPDAIFIADSETGLIVNANSTASKWMNMPVEKIIGLHYTKLGLQDEIKRTEKQFKKHIKMAQRDGITHPFENTLAGANGTTIPVEIKAAMITVNGKSFLMGVFRDITERKKAEKAIEREKTGYCSLAEHTTDSVFCYEFDPPISTDAPEDDQIRLLYNGILAECNKVCAVSYGYTEQDEIVGMKVSQLYKGNTGRLDDLFTAFIRNNYTVSNNERIDVLPDGSKRYFLDNLTGVVENQKLIRIWGSCKNITDYKKIENALSESEKKYRKLFESSPNAVILIDLNEHITDINTSVEKIFGYKKEDVLGKVFSDFPIFDEKTKDILIKRFNLTKKSIQTTSNEYCFTRLDGATKWISIRNSYLQLEHETLRQVIVTDITDYKEAELELRESEKKLREIIDLLPETIWETDVEGNFTFVSQNGLAQFGYTMEDVRQGVNILDLVMPEDRDRAKQNMQKLLLGEKIGNSEYFLQRKDGSQFAAYVHGTFIIRDGAPVGMRGVVVDVSERKHLEEQLRIRERMNSLGTLAGGIAHDFNNLLTGIMGYLELLRIHADNLTSGQREYLEESLGICKRSAKLIRNFQTLSRDSVSKKVPVDLHQVAQEVFSMLERTTDRLIEKKFDIPPDIFYIQGHVDQVHQVLLNLGTNAVHAIEEKGVKPGDYIRISAGEISAGEMDDGEVDDGTYVHIVFEDNGVGMTDKIKQQVFDPLFTTKGRGTEKGQGLGLSIVYNIITRNHNGHIKIDSSKGNGTKFHLFIPKAETSMPAEPVSFPAIKGGDETILIIEDEESILKIAKKTLRAYGYSVIAASDGAEGLELYAKNMNIIDVVLLDLSMPKLSGDIVLKKLLKLYPEVKVIISSGHSERKMQEYTGAKGYIAKPFVLEDLAKKVRNVLDS